MPTARWPEGADFARTVLPTSSFVRLVDLENTLARSQHAAAAPSARAISVADGPASPRRPR
jgi:hypothetical protein